MVKTLWEDAEYEPSRRYLHKKSAVLAYDSIWLDNNFEIIESNFKFCECRHLKTLQLYNSIYFLLA